MVRLWLGDMELPGSRETVRIGARVVAVVYLVLVPVHLLLLTGGARWVMVAAAAATAALATVCASRLDRAEGRAMDRLVWCVCSAPVVNSHLKLLVTGRLEQTTVLMLAIVGIGAVMTRPRHALVLVGLAFGGWVGVVAATHPSPASSTVHYATQLVLSCLVGAIVMAIRSSIGRRLAVSETRLVEQLLSMEGVRIRLADSLSHFRAVFDDSPVAIALSDDSGRFVQVNAAMCRLLGRPADQVLGRTSLEFTHPVDQAINAQVGGLIDGAPDRIARVEKRYVRPGGEVRWAWLTLTHVSVAGDAQWTLAHVQDVTERRKADDVLARTRESLAAAAEIARVTQLGGDPRPVVLRHLQQLAGATSVSLLEPAGEDRLVVAASVGRPDLVGVELDLDEPSATAHVWRTGEGLFASHVESHPIVSRRLLQMSDAQAMQWQPVGLDGELHAVLTIAWDSSVPEVTEVERSVVEALAAETGAALTGERLRHQLEALSEQDPLTGLLNRRGWDRQLAAMRRRSERDGGTVTLAILDLDHFKAFNDTRGHAAGDRLLAEFASAARAVLRETDLIARWGGEEFVVALAGCPEGGETRQAVEQIRTAVPEAATCSAGYARLGAGESVSGCLGRADAALYAAKSGGRDRSVDASRLREPVGSAPA